MFTVITPSTHDIGAFDVRRTLPNKERTMVGPFIFVDQFGPAHFDIGQGMDVRPHPHINLATVTYLFEGAIDHRDSLGTWATIRPGARASIIRQTPTMSATASIAPTSCRCTCSTGRPCTTDSACASSR